jgi:CheY-like chemotaxis protein
VEHLRATEGTPEVNGNHPSATRIITVLVIDSDAAVRLAAKSVLEAAGLTVIAVADAATAFERLAVLRADLVICDIDASTLDGRLAISAIAEIDSSARILTLVTKHRGPASGSSCIGNKLEKPFTPSELLTEVRRALAAPPRSASP